MPGFLLHQGAIVQCSHGAPAMPVCPQPRVTVSGMPITTMPRPYIVAGCPIAPAPICVTANWITSALRVTSCGEPVLLFDSQALANNGFPLRIVQTQMRAKGL